ncbi:hypothetical protein ACU686_25140 [Yinghuangia aomiensis]
MCEPLRRLRRTPRRRSDVLVGGLGHRGVSGILVGRRRSCTGTA